MREWLASQAAGVLSSAYDAASGKYTLPPEQALALADETSPVFLPGFFEVVAACMKDEPKITDAFRSGKGSDGTNTIMAYLPALSAFSVPIIARIWSSEWIPALDGVEAKLKAGAKVADVGCGLGTSTILMAQGYPKSTFVGFDYHDGSIKMAREAAAKAGVGDRVKFEVAKAKDYPGKGFEFVAFFDCLHDMGDPEGAARHVKESMTSRWDLDDRRAVCAR